MKKLLALFISLLLMLNLVACGAPAEPEGWYSEDGITITQEKTQQILNSEFTTPKNIILIIGDGMGLKHIESGMLYDPETNIKYGTYCLSYLYDRYGNWETAIAAYNGGLGNVDKWLEDDKYADGEGGLKRIPFKETRQFVTRVTDAWEMYEKLYNNS